MQRPMDNRLLGTLLVAAAYFLTGKLGLLLAIPPGYATAVWPPSGIALGALLLYGNRLWPGVLLGSFLTNIATSFDSTSGAAMIQSSSLALTIASGAALQAILGSVLIRRFANFQGPLTNERDIFSFFLFGGPAACLTNASVGVSALMLSGAIPSSAASYSWWTWWAGDTIGVLIFAPLTIMWLGPLQQWRHRRVAVTLPLVTMFAVAVLVFVYASRSQWNELEKRFNEDAGAAAAAIERALALNTAMLRATGGLFAASQTVEEQEFRRFLRLLMPHHPELQAVTWVPRIEHAERAQYEATYLLQEQGNLGIFEHQGKDSIRAPQRARYFPVTFAEPPQGHVMLGFDLASEGARRSALQRACVTGKITATEPLRLLDEESTNGFLLLVPVHATPTPAASVSCDNLRGFVVGIVNVRHMLEKTVGLQLDVKRMRLSIDDTATGDQLYAAQAETAVRAANSSSVPFKTQIMIGAGERSWTLRFEPTLDYVVGDRALVVWIVLAGGLALSALVGAGALILTGRTSEIAALVKSRTEELARSNEQLAVKVDEHIRAEQELAHERNFFKTLLENLSDGIVIFDQDGGTVMANRAARETHARIAGVSERSANWNEQYSLCYPNTRAPIPLEQLPRYRALSGETVRNFEMLAVAENRSPVALMVTSQPLTDRHGQRSGGITIVRDITEAREADRLKSEFVSVVSHELRTPLTSIFGSLGLVRGGVAGKVPDKAQQLIELAFRNAERLTLLINDILDIEKIESGELRLRLKTQPLQPLVRQAIDANAGYAQSCDVTFVLAQPVADAQVSVDENRLLQVLANLLSNAAKFSPAGSTVEIGIAATAETARLSVADRGPGIAPEFQSRIFHKFSQADGSDTRAKPGTGLGLSISRALIERMNGKIGYTTKVGVGTTFYFELPVV